MDGSRDMEDLLRYVTLLSNSDNDGSERKALIEVSPIGFHYRPPLPPHKLSKFSTDEDTLFQTIHMGAAVIDKSKWKLVIDGLVERPFSIDWSQLMLLPKESITAFHECYGSPIKPPVENLWRIGNVTWAGVPLKILLNLAKPLPEASYVWSDGLEHGSFAEVTADRYQKDMTLSKAMMNGTLVAYQMNGELLGKERGGPVRLIVPGWYGTNSTKWLCRISLQDHRSKSPFTTVYYNEIDPTDRKKKRKRPCWEVEPNSFILTKPSSEESVTGPDVCVAGRAWGDIGIDKVAIYIKQDEEWKEIGVAKIAARQQYEWQYFETVVHLSVGTYELMARATDDSGITQPLKDRRNHVHSITITVT